MAKSLLYLSDEWIKIAKEKLENELSPEKMNNLTTSLACFYKNCPENCDKFLYVGYKDGNLDKLYVGVGEPDDAEFKITGEYQTFAKISQAKMSSQKALMTGALKLKGNMLKALKLASISDRVNKVFSTIPCNY